MAKIWLLVASVSIVAVLYLTGCAQVLPSHPNSFDREGEKVSIRFLDSGDFNKLVKDLGVDPSVVEPARIFVPTHDVQSEEAAGLALVGAAIVGMAVDFVSEELDNEASRYERQFGQRIIGDSFWAKAGEDGVGLNGEQWIEYRQNLVGFEIVRETDQFARPTPAFRALFHLVPSSDSQLLRVKPVYLQIEAASAKVLDVRAIAPLSVFLPLFRETGDRVDVRIDVTLDGVFMDEERTVHRPRLASFSVNTQSYDLSERKALMAEQLGENIGGWFPAIPISHTVTGIMPELAGNFVLEVRVTETDPSNIPGKIKDAGELVGKNRDQIIKFVLDSADIDSGGELESIE